MTLGICPFVSQGSSAPAPVMQTLSTLPRPRVRYSALGSGCFKGAARPWHIVTIYIAMLCNDTWFIGGRGIGWAWSTLDAKLRRSVHHWQAVLWDVDAFRFRAADTGVLGRAIFVLTVPGCVYKIRGLCELRTIAGILGPRSKGTVIA